MSHLGQRARLGVEVLEERLLPAATLSGGVLRIEGTEGDDVIRVRQSSGRIEVVGLPLVVTASAVVRVEVRGLGGNDVIRLDSRALGGTEDLLEPCSVWGGDGDDSVVGAAGADQLFGGAGADTLAGGTGNDKVYGEAGDDRVSGQDGHDYLDGGTGRDVLDGGTGRDRFQGGGGTEYSNWDTYKDVFDLRRPFSGGASPLDVQQGEVPSCQTLAALAAVASSSGTTFLQNRIRYLGNARFRVLIGSSWVPVKFGGTWTDSDPKPSAQERFLSPTSGAERNEFWTVLFSRARLAVYGIRSFRHYTRAQWNEIDRAWGHRVTSAVAPLRQFTSERPVVMKYVEALDFHELGSALASGRRVVAVTNPDAPPSVPNADGIVGWHVYAVKAVFTTIDGRRWVELINPWGTDAGSGRTLDVAPNETSSNDGRLTVEWSDFLRRTNFSAIVMA